MPYIEFDYEVRQFGPGVLTVGSGPEAAWRIANYDLAPLHAVFAVEPSGEAKVAAGRPGSPVQVNGEEIIQGWRALVSGDAIRLGSAELKYRQYNEDGSGAYLHDTRRDRVYTVGAEGATLGRDIKCAVPIQEAEISRRHAELRRVESGYVVAPAGGITLVNGERVMEQRELHDGDVVTIGRTTLRFSTTTPPRGIAADGRRDLTDRRVASMRTTFMGIVETHEVMRRYGRQRRAVVVGAAIALAVSLAGALFLARDGLARQLSATSISAPVAR